jgi:hypothetical protein
MTKNLASLFGTDRVRLWLVGEGSKAETVFLVEENKIGLGVKDTKGLYHFVPWHQIARVTGFPRGIGRALVKGLDARSIEQQKTKGDHRASPRYGAEAGDDA